MTSRHGSSLAEETLSGEKHELEKQLHAATRMNRMLLREVEELEAEVKGLRGRLQESEPQGRSDKAEDLWRQLQKALDKIHEQELIIADYKAREKQILDVLSDHTNSQREARAERNRQEEYTSPSIHPQVEESESVDEPIGTAFSQPSTEEDSPADIDESAFAQLHINTGSGFAYVNDADFPELVPGEPLDLGRGPAHQTLPRKARPVTPVQEPQRKPVIFAPRTDFRAESPKPEPKSPAVKQEEDLSQTGAFPVEIHKGARASTTSGGRRQRLRPDGRSQERSEPMEPSEPAESSGSTSKPDVTAASDLVGTKQQGSSPRIDGPKTSTKPAAEVGTPTSDSKAALPAAVQERVRVPPHHKYRHKYRGIRDPMTDKQIRQVHRQRKEAEARKLASSSGTIPAEPSFHPAAPPPDGSDPTSHESQPVVRLPGNVSKPVGAPPMATPERPENSGKVVGAAGFETGRKSNNQLQPQPVPPPRDMIEPVTSTLPAMTKQQKRSQIVVDFDGPPLKKQRIKSP